MSLDLYSIDWHKVISDTLPSFLRKPRLLALLLVCLSPLIWLYGRFAQDRDKDLHKLQHNGQVCSQQGLLEEQYPSSLGLRYKIEDVRQSGLIIYTHSESRKGVPLAIPESSHGLLITSGEVKAVETSRFLVYVPQDIYDTHLPEVRWLVEQYKLPTKLPIFLPLKSN